MAETLTYDPATDTATVGDNLTPEEQQSFEVGEKLVEAQDDLILGKYKNAEELEKAYIELEKKLGEPGASNEEVSTEEETPEVSAQVTLITDASTEYAEKGELSDETLAKFSEMSSKDLVTAYMEAAKNQQPTPVADLTDSEVNTIQNSVGGETAYKNLMGWANNNLGSDVLESFNSLVNSGNSGAIQLALSGLKAQQENTTGYEGRMLTGKSAKASGDGFRSQAELVAAMGDPRYDNDPAYRQDVIEKLERSDINF